MYDVKKAVKNLNDLIYDKKYEDKSGFVYLSNGCLEMVKFEETLYFILKNTKKGYIMKTEKRSI